MKRAVLLVVFVCAAVAAVPRLRAQTPVPTPEGYPSAGQPPIVTVLSPGAAPRKALRYKFASGRRDHMNMDMLIGMNISMTGADLPPMQMPTMRMGADLATTSVTPDGDASYTLKFTDMKFLPTPGVDPQMISAMQNMPVDITQLQGTAVVTSRGVTREMKLDLDKITDPQLSQMMGSVSSSMQTLSMALPESAVGVGARWELRQSVESGGMHSFQKYEFELVSMDDNGCKLAAKVEQMAPPQALHNPAMPPGTEASIEKLTGAGSGTMAIRWDSIVPTSEMNIQSSMVLNMSMSGSSQQMTMATTMKVSISPVK